MCIAIKSVANDEQNEYKTCRPPIAGKQFKEKTIRNRECSSVFVTFPVVTWYSKN